MNSLRAGQAVAVWNVLDGVWSVREVYRRVEFFIDEVGVGELIRTRERTVVEDQVSPFNVSAERAGAALVGEAPFEDWLPDPARVPLLMCECGDLLCGALMVRLTRSGDTVQWADWAWERFYEDAEPVNMPSVTFCVTEYLEAVGDAVQRGGDGPRLLTRVRVRRPGPWWRNLRRVPEERTDRRTMLGWLEAQAVTPDLAAAEGDYFNFLSELDQAQSLVAGVGGKVSKLSSTQRGEARRSLDVVMASRHRRGLPLDTVRAAQWFLALLHE